jgi:hypothetical protein
MTEDLDPLTLTIEIDPAAVDEPRQVMWERRIEEYGQETIADLVKANRSQDLTSQGRQLVNALWDNRDQIQVDPEGVETPRVPAQPGREHD